MKYKILAIDMDGTFLDSQHKPTIDNYSAIRKAAELGVKVVICSGRIPAALKLFLEDMPKNQPIISGNGSIILDSNHKVLYNETIDDKSVREIISILRSNYDNIYYQIMDSEVVYSEHIGRLVKDFFIKLNLSLPRKYRMEFRLVPDMLNYIKSNEIKANKIEIHEENNDLLREIRNKIENIPHIEVVSSGRDSIEIIRKTLNKGEALKKLVNYYGYSLEECIAVGNDENDIEMIKEVGLGIAVRNANEKVKEVADYITKNDNDNNAVAEVVEKFIING